jgi:hypothetical protein
MNTREDCFYLFVISLIVLLAVVGNDCQISLNLLGVDFFFMAIDGIKIVSKTLVDAFSNMNELHWQADGFIDSIFDGIGSAGSYIVNWIGKVELEDVFQASIDLTYKIVNLHMYFDDIFETLVNALYWVVNLHIHFDDVFDALINRVKEEENRVLTPIYNVTINNLHEFIYDYLTSHYFWYNVTFMFNVVCTLGPGLSYVTGFFVKVKIFYSQTTTLRLIYWVFRALLMFVDKLMPRIEHMLYNKDWKNGRVGMGAYVGTAYFEPIGFVESTCSYGMPIKTNFTESATMTMRDSGTGREINLREMVENGQLPPGYDQLCEKRFKNRQCYSTISYDVCNVATGCFHDALRCLCGRILCERKYPYEEESIADYQMTISLDMDYLAGPSDHVIPYGIIRWADNMTGKSKRDHKRELERHSYLYKSNEKSFVRKNTRALMHIKVEGLLSKNKICHIPEYRAVQASSKFANVVVGPIIKAVGTWLADNWNMKTALQQGTQSLMTYASGMQAADVGDWFADALSMVDDAVVVVVDFHRWDKNSSGPLNLPFEELLKKLCDRQTLSEEFWAYYRPQVNKTDGVVSNLGIFYSVDEGQVKSGFPYTSCKNTYIQGLATLYGIMKSLQLAGYAKFTSFKSMEGLLHAIALGDDNLIVLPNWMANAVNEHFDDVLHKLGTDPEMSIKSIANAEFCSSTFVPCVDKDGNERYLLTPFSTKMLTKTMFIRRDVNIKKQRGHARNIAINLLPRFNHLPFMRTYFVNAKCYAELHGYKDWIDPTWQRADVWNFKNIEPMYCCDKTYDWITERYGVTKNEMLSLEQYIMAMPDEMCTLAHPALAKMFEVDCHVLLTQHDIENGYTKGNFANIT